MTRKEVYSAIKTMNLADAVKSTFGRNFTQVSTEALIGFIDGNKCECPKVDRLIDLLLKKRILTKKEYESLQ